MSSAIASNAYTPLKRQPVEPSVIDLAPNLSLERAHWARTVRFAGRQLRLAAQLQIRLPPETPFLDLPAHER